MKLKLTGTVTVQYRPWKASLFGIKVAIGKTRKTTDLVDKMFVLFGDSKPRSYTVSGDLKISLFVDGGTVYIVPSVHGYTIGEFQAFDAGQTEMLIRVNDRGVTADLHLELI